MTHDKERTRCVGTLSGAPAPIMIAQEAAGQSWVRGNFLKLDGSRQLVIATNGESGSIVGIAKSDASGTVDTWMEFYLAGPDTIFRSNIYQSNDDPTSSVTAYTDIGMAYGISLVGTYFHVNKYDSGNAICSILKFPLGTYPGGIEEIGDTYGHVDYVIAPAKRQIVI